MKQHITRSLDNDVPVLLMNYPDAETVAIGVSFNVGSRNEWQRGPQYNGISHFLEHQFLNGDPARNLTAQTVKEKLDSLGGESNAFTWKHITCYFTKTLSSEVNEAIDLWEQLLNFGEISKEEFEKEAFVVRQEFKMKKIDNTFFMLLTELSKQLHKGTSLEMDVIGTEEALSSVSMEEMRYYRSEHYELNNAVIMVLGNINTAEVYQKLNETFGQWTFDNEKPHYHLVEYQKPKISSLRVHRYSISSPLVFIGIGIKIPGAKSELYPSIEILAALLNLGNTSLIQRYFVQSGLAAYANCGTDIYEDVGELTILIGTAPHLIDHANTAIFKVLHELLHLKINEKILSQICDKIEYHRLRKLEDPLEVLRLQAMAYWDLGEFLSEEEYITKLRDVTVEQFEKTQKVVLGELKGVYLLAGEIPSNFNPKFPKGMWKGNFVETE